MKSSWIMERYKKIEWQWGVRQITIWNDASVHGKLKIKQVVCALNAFRIEPAKKLRLWFSNMSVLQCAHECNVVRVLRGGIWQTEKLSDIDIGYIGDVHYILTRFIEIIPTTPTWSVEHNSSTCVHALKVMSCHVMIHNRLSLSMGSWDALKVYMLIHIW